MKHKIQSAMKAAALSAVAFVAFPWGLQAMPASPRPVLTQQPDGTFAEVLLHGDEHCHAITTPDGLTALRRDAAGRLVADGAFDADAFGRRAGMAARKAPARIQSTNSFPAHGSQRALAILVEYPETKEHPQGRKFLADDPRGLFDDLLNSDNYSTDGATGSVRKYFKDSSNGIFDITFDVFGPVMLKNDLSYYCKLTNGENLDAWRMVVEACEAIDDEVDFHQYDRDGDGLIDNVYVFYAGPGGATGGDPTDCIWQHASDVELLSGTQYLFDGLRLNHYACSNEYRDVRDEATGKVVRQTEGIGTVCHEFSHVLGLPDLYDVFGGGTTSPGVWSVMDQGCHLNDSRTPPYFSVLDRMLLGWIEPETIGDAPRTLSLRHISENHAYRIPTVNPDEYFLLENRQQEGWDVKLPGHGLIVWHVNYQKAYWDKNQVNTGRGTSCAVVVPADGSNGPYSYEGDPYPGTARVTGLSDDGYPNMLTVNGERTNAPLSNITEAAGIVSFDICRAVTHLDKVVGLRATNVTPTAFTASWDQLPMSPGYVLNVYSRSDGKPQYAGIYHELSVVGTSVQVTGLTPDTDYWFTVRGIAGAVQGDDSDEYAVKTPAMSFAYAVPEALEATGVTSDGFTAAWKPLEDATDYDITVYALYVGDDRHATVDFTGGIEGLPAGWVTNCIGTMSMNGYYGTSSPSLSMGSDYSRLQSPLLPADLTGISFWYRERTPSGKNSLTIDVLTGEEWVEIDRVELTGTMAEGVAYTVDAAAIPAGARAVRMLYHRQEKGSLALDDVKLAYRGTEESEALDAWVEHPVPSGATQIRVDGLSPLTSYCYTVRGLQADGTPSLPSEAVRVTTSDPTSIAAPEAAPAKVRVAPDGTVTVDGCDDFEVFDLCGRRVGTRLPARGMYIVRLINSISIKLIY